MAFINYESNSFLDLSSDPLVSAEIVEPQVDGPTIIVNGITVCNKTAFTASVNLHKTVVEGGTEDIQLINMFKLEPFQTIDFVHELGLNIWLRSVTIPSSRTETLIAYVTHESQECSCEVSFSELNETPLP